MESFLKLVATDLYNRTQGDLAHTAVVFPNKRAGLFFNEHLAEQSDTPIWSPAYVSISELFRSLSTWEVGDPVKLVCELYKYSFTKLKAKKLWMISIFGGRCLSVILMMLIKIWWTPITCSLICKT